MPELQEILDKYRPPKQKMIKSSVRGVVFEYLIPIIEESNSTRKKVLKCA